MRRWTGRDQFPVFACANGTVFGSPAMRLGSHPPTLFPLVRERERERENQIEREPNREREREREIEPDRERERGREGSRAHYPLN